MQCSEASELMSLRLDGMLSEAESRSLDEHIASCQACVRDWRGLCSLSALFEQAAPAVPPPQLLGTVVARVRRRAAWMRLVRLGSLTVLGLIILFALLGVPAISAVSATASRPATLRALIGLLVLAASVLRSVCGAFGFMLGVLYAGPSWLLALAYVCLTGLLIAAWLRLVTQPERSAWHRTLRAGL